MPEYLSPGVYVEEIEIGAKPIEGVSTSTAGFLGYAERGPLNKPALVTSFADFKRIFGSFLPARKNGTNLNKIRWLAYAVSGFFENGGKRAYITRVALSNAATASGFLPKLPELGTPPALDEVATPKAVTLKLNMTIPADWSDGEVLLLKDGAQSEYLEYKGKTKALTLSYPLTTSYDKDTDITKMAPDDTVYEIEEDVAFNDRDIKLDKVTDLAAEDVLIITDGTNPEICVVDSVNIAGESITVKTSLRFGHSTAVEMKKLTPSAIITTKLITVVKVGYAVIYITNTDTDFNEGDAIMIGDEYFIIAGTDADRFIVISPPLKYTHKKDNDLFKLAPAVVATASSEGTWGNSIKVAVRQSSLCSTKLTNGATNSDRLDIETITGIEPGSLLKLPPTVTPRYVTVAEVHKTSTDTFVILELAFTGTVNEDDPVHTEEFDLYATDGKTDETFKNLSLNPNHSRYVKKIVTKKSSNLICIGDITGVLPVIPMPTPDDIPGWRLTGGNDGFPANPANDNDLNPIYEGQPNDEPALRTGLYTFKNVDEINIVAIPGITSKYLQQKMITHCEITMKDRFAVLDPLTGADLNEIKTQRNLFDTSYAALYYPWVYAFDPLTKEYINIPPSGYVCGIYARTDVERGVHKAPANQKINGVVNLEKLNGRFRVVNKGTQEILNPLGVNCIRAFPGRGIRVWGARTISSNTLWKYINVRRLFLYIEESIEEATQWVVFEPNNEKLWARVRATITEFLTRVWRDGALMGTKAEEAFFVKCDRTTMTQDDIDNGRLICVIGIAPVKPAEFVIFRIAQWSGGSSVTE